MRIGKPLEHMQAAVKGLDISDSVLKATTVGRQIGYAGYLFNDMLVWVCSPLLFPRDQDPARLTSTRRSSTRQRSSRSRPSRTSVSSSARPASG